MTLGQLIRVVGHEFVYGGHLLSLGASAIVWSVLILSNKDGGWPILLIPYLVMQIIYNYDHLSSEVEDTNVERTSYLLKAKGKHISLLRFYFLVFLITCLFANVMVFLWALFMMIGGVLYANKLKPLTKKIAGLKDVYVALFWGLLVFLVSAYYSVIDLFFFALFLFVFIRWVVNTVFFDIKDLRSDRKSGLKTLPVIWGVKRTVMFLHVLNVFSGIFLICLVNLDIFPHYSLLWLFLVLYSGYYLWVGSRLEGKALRNISYVVVDGEYLFWPFLLFVGMIFFSRMY